MSDVMESVGHQAEIEIDLLENNSYNPNSLGQGDFDRLVSEIQNVGFIAPIQVVPLATGKYRIIGGEHRVAAARELKLAKVPAMVLDGPKWQDEDLQQLVTVRLNVLHGKLNPEKLAVLYNRMAKTYGEEALQQLFAFCLRAGTVVETVEGPEPIECVRIGAWVYGGDGIPHQVVNKVHEFVECPLLSFDLERFPQPLECTPGHHMFVCRRNWDASKELRRRVWYSPEEMRAEEIEVGDAVEVPGLVLGEHSPVLHVPGDALSVMRVRLRGPLAEGTGCRAGRGSCGLRVNSHGLCKGHAQKWRAWQDSGRAKFLDAVVDEPAFVFSGRSKQIPEFFVLDKDLAWFLGLYVAEGSYSEDSSEVSLGLGVHERFLADRAVSILGRVFGIEARVRPSSTSDNAIVVRAFSRALGRTLSGWCGNSSTTKRFPVSILTAPREILESALEGYWEGDGTDRDGRRSVATVSSSLVYQCVRILVTLGYGFSLSRVAEDVDRGGYHRHARWQLSWVLRPRSPNVEVGGVLVVEVLGVRSVPYKGCIYDLELEGHHSYIAHGVRVGNTDQHAWDKMLSQIKHGLSKAGVPKDKRKEFDEKAKDARTLHDLERILNELWSSYGDTVNLSFMVFSFGKKEHLYVQADKQTRDALRRVVGHCKAHSKDINLVLGPAIVALADVLKKKDDEERAEGKVPVGSKPPQDEVEF
jgi:intein/homing endonuclease